MGARVALLSALVLIVHACGGEEFSDDPKGSGGSGGGSGGATGGSGGATGGSGGVGGGNSGSGGVAGTGGGAAGSGGVAGTGGASGSGGADGSAGDASGDGNAGDATADASTDATSDAGPVPIAIIQASPVKLSKAPAELTSTITLSSPPKAGNAIIVGLSCISNHGVVMGDAGPIANGDCLVPSGSVTDNHGNSYTQVVQSSPIESSHQAARGYIFISQPIGAPSGAFTIKVDPEGSSPDQGIAWGVIEVAGLSAPPSTDATGYPPKGGGTETTATTFQPTTQANELAVAVLTIRHDATYAGIVPDVTWVSHQIHQDNSNGPPAHSMVSKVLNSVGKISHTWNHVTPTRGTASVIATFKGAATN